MAREISVNKPALKRIYQAVGGEAGLAKILEAFYHRMSQDLLIGYFFDGKNLDAIAEKQKEFLMRAMGALPVYTGKPPAQAHDRLPKILRGHFDRRLRILEQILREHGLPEEDIREWIIFESAFREGIQQEEGPPESGR